MFTVYFLMFCFGLYFLCQTVQTITSSEAMSCHRDSGVKSDPFLWTTKQAVQAGYPWRAACSEIMWEISDCTDSSSCYKTGQCL